MKLLIFALFCLAGPVLVPAARTNEREQLFTVKRLISRLLPGKEDLFELSVSPICLGTAKCYNLRVREGRIQIFGSSGVELASGLHRFLKNACKSSISWRLTGGNQIDTSCLEAGALDVSSLDVYSERSTPWSYYQNVVTPSYSMAYWNWSRWEQELDWMALQGINLPLAFTGQEKIWQKAFSRFNVSAAELQDWFAGPSFLAWQRMGNLQGWGGPLPQAYIDAQAELQVKILERMRAFGMTPVLPAFAGFVPNAIHDKFPDAAITQLGNWGSFTEQYCCVHLLDPQDPLFRQIGQAFVQEMRQAWGHDSIGYYSADTFNEQSPPSAEPDYLRNASRGVFEAMQAGDETAVWIQQAWLFYSDQAFWQPPQIQALLEGVPQDRLIMLDLFAEVFPLWNRTEAFQGVPFIWCMLHNFGGNLEMYGNMKALARGPADALQEPNMVGIGLCPEGIETNPIVYDLMPEWAYREEAIDLGAWTKDYVVRRYGPSTPDSAVDAWDLLLGSVYNCQDLHLDHNQDIPVSRPGLGPADVAPLGLQPRLWYKPEKVMKAWSLMLEAAQELEEQSTYRYDLIDVGRQVISKAATALWKDVCQAYEDKDLKALSKANADLLQLLDDLDELLASHEGFLLGPHIEEARAAGNTTEDKSLFEFNLRTQITIWGTGKEGDSEVHDYANKEWAGLLQSFYRGRWSMWLHRLQADLVRGKEYDAVAVKKDFLSFTTSWTHREEEGFPLQPSGDTVDISRDLFKKYGRDDEPFTSLQMLHELSEVPKNSAEGQALLSVDEMR
ncbi:hypothetical protein WJX74_000989 [Apatococcus lobatus]|uniref:Alpha-N-acetylglucosaminidase n=1 Tax=Apatococcus lobatus TaxID=904363 RepID=A0AAW1S5E1_9CHLO